MLAWNIKKNKKTKPSWLWHITWLLFGAILIFIGIKQNSPLTIIVFMLILALLAIIRQKPAQNLKIKIGKKGIKINKDFYSYEDLDSFSISNFYLTLKPKKSFSQNLRIPIIDDSGEIKKYLKKYLKYKKQEENILDILAERLGF